MHQLEWGTHGVGRAATRPRRDGECACSVWSHIDVSKLIENTDATPRRRRITFGKKLIKTDAIVGRTFTFTWDVVHGWRRSQPLKCCQWPYRLSSINDMPLLKLPLFREDELTNSYFTRGRRLPVDDWPEDAVIPSHYRRRRVNALQSDGEMHARKPVYRRSEVACIIVVDGEWTRSYWWQQPVPRQLVPRVTVAHLIERAIRGTSADGYSPPCDTDVEQGVTRTVAWRSERQMPCRVSVDWSSSRVLKSFRLPPAVNALLRVSHQHVIRPMCFHLTTILWIAITAHHSRTLLGPGASLRRIGLWAAVVLTAAGPLSDQRCHKTHQGSKYLKLTD